MENLFLYTLNELEGNLGYLMTDKFASHALRVLLMVLSGQPLAKTSASSLLASKKKENIGVTGLSNKFDKLGSSTMRTIPDSFHAALEKMIADAVAGLDTSYLRALATHPVGNPVLQLLLELELSGSGNKRAKDEKSLLSKLLPDNPPGEGTESAAFIHGLVYNSIGSRLVETLVQCAPGKTFKVLYRGLFKERLGTLARNEIAGFLVERILERLSKEDLEEAVLLILPQVESLVQRSRTSIIKTMIERCAIRKVETLPIADALEKAYGTDPRGRLLKMLKVTLEAEPTESKNNANSLKDNGPEKIHGSLLAQAMLLVPGPLSLLISDSMLMLSIEELSHIAKDQSASRVLQASLVSVNTSKQYRRKVVQKFYEHITELATHATGSHVIDCLWTATKGLSFIQEHIADELLANEAILRESFPGRAVWRNWKMDLYKRRRLDWIMQAKANGSVEGVPNAPPNSQIHGKERSGIEVARERFAEAQVQKIKGGKAKIGTGVNGMTARDRRINVES